MSNQSIIAIPSDIDNPTQLRQFLVRLVIELDIVLGYREGATPLVTEEEFEAFKDKLGQDKITQLPAYVQTLTDPLVTTEVQTMSDQVTSVTNKVNEILTALQQTGVIETPVLTRKF